MIATGSLCPPGGNQFKRTEVHGGKMLRRQAGDLSGLEPGQQVVTNALSLESTVSQ
jgi:hypothetical protein